MTAMPMLMEKKDWTRTISSLGNVNRVWREDVSGGTDVVPLTLPGLGPYRVYIVEVGDARSTEKPKRKSARDFLGYGARFHKPRKTEVWMRELREDESSQAPKTVSLFETLRNCPFGGVELNVERDHTSGRQVEFA